MPGAVAETPRPTGFPVPTVNPPAAASTAALPEHTVEVAPPDGPRNPVVRALTSFARLITRCFTPSPASAPRVLSPQEQATHDTRTQLSKLFKHLLPQTPR